MRSDEQMTIKEMIAYGIKYLRQHEIQDADIDARYLAEYVLKVDRSYVFLHLEDAVSDEVFYSYKTFVEERANHKPLQYITGTQEFMGLSFAVNEHVLIPRQDTEILVETAINLCKNKRSKEPIQALDLCSGSGCIGISLKSFLNRLEISSEVFLSDLSNDALNVSRINADTNQVNLHFLQGDLFDSIEKDTIKFDMIISNPPYIRSDDVDRLMPEVLIYEPRMALDGDSDGLKFYRRIATEAKAYLKDDGYVLFEIGFDQAEDVREILVDAGYHEITVKKDLALLDRVVVARMG